MYKFLSVLLFGVALLASSNGASAQTDAATAEALMRSSGLWQQLTSIAPQVRAGFLASLSQPGADVSAAEVERLSKVIDTAYAPDKLRLTARRTVESGLKAADVHQDDDLGATPRRRAEMAQRAGAVDRQRPADVDWR